MNSKRILELEQCHIQTEVVKHGTAKYSTDLFYIGPRFCLSARDLKLDHER